MKLQTPVILDPTQVKISYGSRILVLGSCFADEIGQRFADAGFDVLHNPFGTLYNPVSIAGAIARLDSGKEFSEKDVVEMGAGAGRVCSLFHHTSFARETAKEFLENANESLSKASEFWRSCDRVVITLGTAWAFRFNATGETVANCLKRPGTEFTRYRLSVEQCSDILQGLVRQFPDRQFMFSVSPIRHLGDGARGNQLSKSTLILATDGLPYFPAYEIMMDELRDYRWWAEDMVHPTKQAAAYICDRFMDWVLPEGEKELYEQKIRQWRQSRHSPALRSL